MLKALIGLAAVAVIAAVGYYFWSEWQDAQAAERLAEWRYADAVCDRIFDLRYGGNTSKEIMSSLDHCYNTGHLDPVDVKRRLDAR